MKNPHDARFQFIAEGYPHLLLRLFGLLERDAKPQILDLPRELQLDPVVVDHLYLVGEAPDARIFHFEAFSGWKSNRIPTLALYLFLTRHKYKLPVTSFIVLMAERHAPKTWPPKLVYEDDGFRVEAPYKVLRLWERDSALAFEPDGKPLLPWVPLLKGGLADFERAAVEIERLFDHRSEAPYEPEAMVTGLASLAALRYDKDAIGEFLRRFEKKMFANMDVFKESWLFLDGVAEGEAKGEAKGKAEGEAKGKAEGMRESLRVAVSIKFPESAAVPEIDRVNDASLDGLLRKVLQSATIEEARAAIVAAAA